MKARPHWQQLFESSGNIHLPHTQISLYRYEQDRYRSFYNYQSVREVQNFLRQADNPEFVTIELL